VKTVFPPNDKSPVTDREYETCRYNCAKAMLKCFPNSIYTPQRLDIIREYENEH
jgi:hypothetical protein